MINADKINMLADKLQKSLDRKTTSNLNKVINKMQHSTDEHINHNTQEYNEAKSFNDFIRFGDTQSLITKSLSSNAGEAGVVVTPTLNKKIISAVQEKSVIRQIASVENIASKSLDIIIEDGNFGCGWVSETQERAETNTSKLIKKTITAHELYAQPKATQSLINDAEINIENWLTERLSSNFAELESAAFLNGDGRNKPHGLMKNNDVKRIDAGAEITPDILIEAINDIHEAYRNDLSMVMNRKTLSAIQSLKDNQGRFIWQQPLSHSLQQTIFGIPVYTSSHMPDIGADSTAIALGNFRSAYRIVDRNSINILRDPYTDKPFVRFYAVKRTGGDVINPEAMRFIKFSA